MRDQFIATLGELAAEDARIILITGDLGFGVLDEFERRFPRQYLNVGVAEQNMTGVATGLALEGRIVYTYSIGNFPTLRCLEQIRNGPCYHGLNVNIVSIGGGFSYGNLGFTHHATEDLAIMRALPGMTVLAPCDVWEVSEATRAIAARPGPAYLRLDKSKVQTNHTATPFRIGEMRRLREGKALTIVTCGGVASEAMYAADLLAGQGVDCRVLSAHTIKPIDSESLLLAAQETGGIVTVEEHAVDGGLGGAVAECCLANSLWPKKFKRLGLETAFTPVVGDQGYLRQLSGLTATFLSASILELLQQPMTHAVSR